MTYNSKEEKIKIPLRPDVILLMTSLCLSDNKNILLKDYINLKKLLDRVDTDSLQMSINNNASAYYFELMKFFLEEKVVKKISNNNFIRGKIFDESSNREMFKDIRRNTEELSTDDLLLIRNFINERIRYIHLYESVDELDNLLLNIRTDNFQSLEDMSQTYESIIKKHFSIVTQTKSNSDEIMNSIILDEDGIRTLAEDSYNNLNQEGNRLSSGIVEFDNRIPLVRGELTLLGAPSGGFKSGTMLNLIYNMKLYNSKIVTNDPTKKPLFLYISLENKQRITFLRSAKLLLNMDKQDVRTTEPDLVVKRYHEYLNSLPTSCKEASIKIQYFPSNKINVSDIYGMIEEEEHNGFEVVGICVDYIKGLKPEQHSRNRELRMQLSDSSRALADLAVLKDMVVISAFQLNRSAIEAQVLNSTLIQEAHAMIDHADNVAFLRRIYSPEQQCHFIQFFESKGRSNEGIMNTGDAVYIPLDPKNQFRILPTKYETNPFAGQIINHKVSTTDGKNNNQPMSTQPMNPVKTQSGIPKGTTSAFGNMGNSAFNKN